LSSTSNNSMRCCSSSFSPFMVSSEPSGIFTFVLPTVAWSSLVLVWKLSSRIWDCAFVRSYGSIVFSNSILSFRKLLSTITNCSISWAISLCALPFVPRIPSCCASSSLTYPFIVRPFSDYSSSSNYLSTFSCKLHFFKIGLLSFLLLFLSEFHSWYFISFHIISFQIPSSSAPSELLSRSSFIFFQARVSFQKVALFSLFSSDHLQIVLIVLQSLFLFFQCL
jgi:hypothetical protein